jgi:hypothetical protein
MTRDDRQLCGDVYLYPVTATRDTLPPLQTKRGVSLCSATPYSAAPRVPEVQHNGCDHSIE